MKELYVIRATHVNSSGCITERRLVRSADGTLRTFTRLRALTCAVELNASSKGRPLGADRVFHEPKFWARCEGLA